MSFIGGLDYAAAVIHETAVEKGFWQGEPSMDQFAAKIALIHSECTELLEALRKNKGGRAISDECADIIIRTLDLHTMLREWLQNPDMVPMAQAIDEKMKANAKRPAKHGWVWG